MNKVQISILVAYALLLVFCAALIFLSDSLGPTAKEQMLPLAANGFEFVLGALAGALSTIMGGQYFNNKE